jgi:hypothetical protein
MKKNASGAVLEREHITYEESDVANWVRLIQSEYLEMPGMHLTEQQVQRLCGLDAQRCHAALDVLETSKFLKRTAANIFVRTARCTSEDDNRE